MVRPIGITADRKRAILSVAWNDGRTTNYPFYDLSAACPCANCNDERQKLSAQGLEPAKDFKPKSSYLQHIEPIGTYAINIVWKDGCRYGIYTWDYLLDLDERHPGWRETQTR
jgi:DUF971 family protein